MKLTITNGIVLAIAAIAVPGSADAQANRELKVHLVQANNDNTYPLVRAKFQPGEVADPWTVNT